MGVVDVTARAVDLDGVASEVAGAGDGLAVEWSDDRPRQSECDVFPLVDVAGVPGVSRISPAVGDRHRAVDRTPLQRKRFDPVGEVVRLALRSRTRARVARNSSRSWARRSWILDLVATILAGASGRRPRGRSGRCARRAWVNRIRLCSATLRRRRVSLKLLDPLLEIVLLAQGDLHRRFRVGCDDQPGEHGASRDRDRHQSCCTLAHQLVLPLPSMSYRGIGREGWGSRAMRVRTT